MKQVLLSVLLIVALTLVACDAGDPPPTSVPSEPEVTVLVVTATPEPVEEATSADPTTFLNATIGSPETFDPALVYETSGGNVVRNTYETLITYDREDALTSGSRLSPAPMPCLSLMSATKGATTLLVAAN
jgi:ABC-type transport system substrate-binding protein